jgi:hypothetical protein
MIRVVLMSLKVNNIKYSYTLLIFRDPEVKIAGWG